MPFIFITGVSSGIGYDALKTLVKEGYHVIGTVRKTDDKLRIENEIADRCTILIMDVTDINGTKSEVSSIFPLLEKEGLYCLINNAGIATPGPLQYLDEHEFENQMDVNVKSVRRITNLLLPYLGTDKKYQPGKIINISSISGLFNSPYNGAYCISKHALESMTDIYRRELATFGIKVSAIEPGPIKTEIWAKNKGSMDRFIHTEYGELLSSADKMIENAEQSALPVIKVTQKILDILNTDQPKTRYLIHKKKFLFTLLSQYLPDRFVDRLVAKTLAKKDHYRPV